MLKILKPAMSLFNANAKNIQLATTRFHIFTFFNALYYITNIIATRSREIALISV